jgi:hypothetical protein
MKTKILEILKVSFKNCGISFKDLTIFSKFGSLSLNDIERFRTTSNDIERHRTISNDIE